MSQQDNKNQIPVAYPPQASATTYMVPPPPVGNPTRDGQQAPQNAVPIETKTKGNEYCCCCCFGS